MTLRQIPVQLAIVALAAALSLATVAKIPFAAMGERWLSDYRIATLLPTEKQHPDIVVVAITEDTLQRFPYRSPVDRAFLASVIQTLEKDGARAIGIDILFDQPTEAAKDEALKAVLAASTVPISIAIAGPEDGLMPEQIAYLNDFVPPRLRGYTNLVKDAFDATVRTAFPGRAAADGVFVPGLAFALAAKLGTVSEPAQAPEIAWHGRPDADTPAFRHLPAHAVKVLPAAWLKNKVVLIGADLSLTDRHRSPFSSALRGPNALMPGVDIHAHALAQILDHRQPATPSDGTSALLVLVVAAMGALLARLPWGLAAKLAAAVAVTGGLWIAAFAVYRGMGILLPLVSPTLALSGALWATDLHTSREDRKMKKFITDAFSRYVSPAIVGQLLTDPSSLKLGGERREISVLFTDLAGFTTLSENNDPDTVGPLLNQYLGGISQIIVEEQGTIVDFIGDAVMAIFGAPVHQADHAAHAVACARKIDAFSENFRSTGTPAQLDWGITRIGIHSGAALVGNFGADLRFKYSPVGDCVNTCSRLEGLNKHFSTHVIASAAVLSDAEREFARPVGRVVLKGRTESIEVFELIDPAQAQSPYMRRYRQAYAALDNGDIAQAEAELAILRDERPDDGCTTLHQTRIAAGHRDTVVHMTEK
jgi:adenylate cyclase